MDEYILAAERIYSRNPTTRTDPKHVRDHLWYWPNGCHFSLDGGGPGTNGRYWRTRLLVCGGAYSIDKPERLMRMRAGRVGSVTSCSREMIASMSFSRAW